MNVGLLEINSPEWSDFVNSCSDSLPYHLPSWSRLLADCYGYRPFVIAVTNGNHHILAGIPLMEILSSLTGQRWVSLPFTDYCPPLFIDEQALTSLLEYLKSQQMEQHLLRAEIRWRLPQREGIHESSGFVLHKLDLSGGFDTVANCFSRMHKQNTGRARREGVTVKRSISKNALDTFFALMIKTRRLHGMPVQPRYFFDLLWDNIINKDLGFVMLAYRNNLPLAGGVFLYHKSTLSFKYSASTSTGKEYRANNLLAWEAIKWACEHDYRVFDWGRTNISNDGLRAFKNRWGSLEAPLTYSVISDRSPTSRLAAVDKAISYFIRHSPSFVCREAGRLLYKHFG